MLFQEIVKQVSQLSHDEKLQLVEFLQSELATETFATNTTYEVWSPQVTDPDAMAFLVNLEKVLRTEGLDAANKLITREDKH